MQSEEGLYGSYYLMGLLLTIQPIDGGLGASMPGLPSGFEIRLEPLGGDAYRLHGGPADGSTAVFTRDEAGDIRSVQVGDFELAKIPPEKLAKLHVQEELPAPGLLLTPEKQAAFQVLYEAILSHPDGGWIDYRLPYPKHEFVQYVMSQDVVIFHGSNNQEIAVFQPVRTSYELHDRRGRGNLQAVYGTHDGLWAMFFAIVDRQRLRGSIRNGVSVYRNQAGTPLSMYHFSINQEQLAERPYMEGALYFLPRESFERQLLTEDSYSNEWASPQPVRPLAKLRLSPGDFPFLEQIGGHDDGVLIRSAELGKAISQAASAARLEEERFTICVPDVPENARLLEDYCRIQQELLPAATFRVEKESGSLNLVIDSPPPAFRQVLEKGYAKFLQD